RPPRAGRRPPGHRPGLAEALGRPDGHRPGEPRPGRADPGQHGRRGERPRRPPARAVRPHRRRGPPGEDVLRRHGPQARRGAGHRARAAGAVPRRADHRPRPRGARRDVGRDRPPRRRGGRHRPAHHALPRRGRPARRAAGDRRRRPGGRRGDAGRAQARAARRHGGRRARRGRRPRGARGAVAGPRAGRRHRGPGDATRPGGRRRRRGAAGARRAGGGRPPGDLGDRGPSLARRRVPAPRRPLVRGGGMSALVADAVRTPRVPRASLLRHAGFLTARSTKALWRQPAFAIATLVQPIIWLLLFGELFRPVAEIPGFAAEHGSYLEFITPGVVIMTALFSSGWAGTVYIEDMNRGVMDRLLASPVRRGAMIIGTLAYQGLTTVFQTLVILAIAYAAGARFPGGLPGV